MNTKLTEFNKEEMALGNLIHFHGNYSKLRFIQEHRKDIIPFVGAGISKECGLYLWGELLDKLAQEYFTTEEIKNFHISDNYFNYADEIVKAAGNTHLIMKKIRELFNDTPTHLSISSHILASSFSNMVVTTNYDTILEMASKQSIDSAPLKPLLPCLKGQIDEAIQVNERCLLKLHGSVEETSSFILTSQQYNEFYGSKKTHKKKPLPAYLEKLFSGKKILFVGCSLQADRTLDILTECVEKYERISHYAIVPWYNDDLERIKRTRQLSKMGIEPIYYPNGDFNAIEKLLCYLAQKNDFLNAIEYLLKNLSIIAEQPEFADTLIAVLQQSFYKTAEKKPELLDSICTPVQTEFFNSVDKQLSSLKSNDTLYNILLKTFISFIDMGYFHEKADIKSLFEDNFSDFCLKEHTISDLLKKSWSFEQLFSNKNDTDNKWIKQLPDEELNNFAYDLLLKLQYKNGMSFSDILPPYNMAKEMERIAGERVDFRIRTRLLNSLGAFAPYFKENERGEMFLRQAIQLLNSQGSLDRDDLLFLAKCYHNLTIVLAGQGKNTEALSAISEDIRIKENYNENPQLYSRTLNLYATLLKEYQPFRAGEVYLKIISIKESFALISYKDETISNDMIASWATTLFNIGLLARDVELYNIAYSYILWANEIRFQTVDLCNKDYCNSLNVRAELELLLHRCEHAKEIVTIIESKQNLPEGFSKVIGCTWYICAFYYYLQQDYTTAFDYASKSMNALQEKDQQDIMQMFKSKMLLGSALQKLQSQGKGLGYPSAEIIYNEVINNIGTIYGENSFFLCSPFRYLLQNASDDSKKSLYEKKYSTIYSQYEKDKEHLANNMVLYLKNHKIEY